MLRAVPFAIFMTFCCVSAAVADQVTISCNYSGIYHHTVFNNPDLNKNDEVLSGTFYLTFEYSTGAGKRGYYWGIRPDNNLKRVNPEEGPLSLWEITDDKITIGKHVHPYSNADEYIDRKTGHYEFANFYGDDSRRIKASGDCSKSSLRTIPENKF
jgi:hypothetical protein